MRATELFEQTTAQAPDPDASSADPVLALIQKAAEALGEDKLYGGNCGTFALAIAHILRDQGQPVTLGILFDDSQDLANPMDIVRTESAVYHVVIEFGDKRYDGTGVVTADTLLDIAQDQYHDSAPGYFSDVDPFSTEASLVINSETAWNISTKQFYDLLIDKPAQ